MADIEDALDAETLAICQEHVNALEQFDATTVFEKLTIGHDAEGRKTIRMHGIAPILVMARIHEHVAKFYRDAAAKPSMVDELNAEARAHDGKQQVGPCYGY